MSIIENSIFDPQKTSGGSSFSVKLAEVSAVDSTGAAVQFAGESAAGVKHYKTLKSYTPAVGDRVLLLGISGSYIILGAI